MGEEERTEFLAWYEIRKSEEQLFGNKRVLQTYCQNEVTVLRQACRVFRREFMHMANIVIYLESITVASTCNVFLRKRFLQPETIGL